MFKLLASVFKRLVTAVTNPFRMLIVRVQRLFNVNILTAKLIPPLTKKVKALVTLKPQSPKDYFSVGRYWVYKKLFLTLILALCAGVFLYFSMFAPKVATRPTQPEQVMTSVTFDYDDMDLAEYTGVANIRAADGTVVYVGDVVAGVCTGNGTLKDRKGRLVYEGGFENNQYSGQGIQYWPSGNRRYEGGFENNQYSGEGILYGEDGQTVLYAGSFKNGLRDGTGKAYSESGVLLYEGDFAEDLYHGSGTQYYESGIIAYTGQFFRGQPQGEGTLYSNQGRALYTGAVYAGKINYSALVGATLADIEAAFSETPCIYYNDSESVFLYEEAGVVITVDCRVSVDVWENENAAASESEKLYYMPPSQRGTVTHAAAQPLMAGTTTIRPVGWLAPGSGGSSSSSSSSSSSGETDPTASPTPSPSADAGSGGASSDASDSSSSVSSSSSGGTSSSSGSTSSASSSSSAASATPTPAPTPTPQPAASATPDFIQKNLTLYFEIDTNVWQAEADLDKTKVFVSKVTVCNDTVSLDSLPEDTYEEDRSPSIEDCVAIQRLREDEPTSFSNVTFQLDQQNKLFVEVSGISYANQIQRHVLEKDGLMYEYCYPYDAGTVLDTNPGDAVPMYYSIRKG